MRPDGQLHLADGLRGQSLARKGLDAHGVQKGVQVVVSAVSVVIN